MNEEKFKRENRYFVLKFKDIHSILDESEHQALHEICNKIELHRLKNDRGALECVVVESDWPEYEPTWKAIEERCSGEPDEGEFVPRS